MGAADLHAYQKIKGDVESVEDADDANTDADVDQTSTIENAVLTVLGSLLAITLWMLVRSQSEMPCGGAGNANMPFDYGLVDY
jgi:predicted thioredoxin/glutaredoxin